MCQIACPNSGLPCPDTQIYADHDVFALHMPSGGFFTLAGWLLVFNWARERRARTRALAAEAAR